MYVMYCLKKIIFLPLLFRNTVRPHYSDIQFSRHSHYDASFSKSGFSVSDFNVNKLQSLLTLLNNF